MANKQDAKKETEKVEVEETVEAPQETAKPVKASSQERTMGIREFLSNSKEVKKTSKYLQVGFNHQKMITGAMSERKTEKQWLEDFTAFINKKI